MLVQMPCYPEGATYQDLLDRKDRFLELMQGQAQQHLNLFSRRAARRLFERLGFAALDFVRAIFDYDMYLVASRQTLVQHPIEELAETLTATPEGRVTLAWLELLAQCEAREMDRAARLDVIMRLDAALRASEADRAARLDVITRLDAALRASEADRAAQRAEIERLNTSQSV